MYTTKMDEPPMRIVGIDPGSRFAGFACIEARKKNPVLPKDYKIIDVMTLKPNLSLPFSERIGSLHAAMYKLLVEYKPEVTVIESAFLGINAQSALKLGQVRGAFLSAVHRIKGCSAEISPNQVKKQITGNGHASKEDISLALKTLMGFEQKKLSFDATDALAIALSYGLTLPFKKTYPYRK